MFEKEYESYKKKKINLNKISIVFSKALDDLDYAVCDKHYLETSGVIKVNPNNWNLLSSTEREIVIFHELGHCALGILSHLGEESLMHGEKKDEQEYLLNRDSYLYNLFNKDVNTSDSLKTLKEKGYSTLYMK